MPSCEELDVDPCIDRFSLKVGVERIRRQPCCLGSERESERDYGFMLTFTRLLEFLS